MLKFIFQTHTENFNFNSCFITLKHHVLLKYQFYKTLFSNTQFKFIFIYMCVIRVYLGIFAIIWPNLKMYYKHNNLLHFLMSCGAEPESNFIASLFYFAASANDLTSLYLRSNTSNIITFQIYLKQ